MSKQYTEKPKIVEAVQYKKNLTKSEQKEFDDFVGAAKRKHPFPNCTYVATQAGDVRLDDNDYVVRDNGMLAVYSCDEFHHKYKKE